MLSDECSYTVDGHLVGMLDRDLRTAKTHQKEQPHNRIQCHNNNTCGFTCRRFLSRNSERRCRKLSHHIRKSLQKFKQAAVVLLCFLYVVRIPFAASHPVQNMSDGQEYDYKNLQCKELLSKVNCQAFITKQYANKSYNDLYVNAGPDIPDVDGLKNDSLEFLFTKTREHYGFPDKRPFDPSVVENVSVSDFLMVFDDCLSRFESAFQNLNDSSSEAAGYLKVTRTEIRDYLRCLGTSVEPDAFNIDLYIPKNDKGTVWRMKALVHRDFAMTAEYFSQAMNHFHGECDKI